VLFNASMRNKNTRRGKLSVSCNRIRRADALQPPFRKPPRTVAGPMPKTSGEFWQGRSALDTMFPK
jgi:hypothetical protein